MTDRDYEIEGLSQHEHRFTVAIEWRYGVSVTGGLMVCSSSEATIKQVTKLKCETCKEVQEL